MGDVSRSGEGLASIRARVSAVGLDLDDDRLRALSETMLATDKMVAAIERVQFDPVDLAEGSFDPAWAKEGRRR